MVNKNVAIPGVKCQTLGLKIPGSDYIGDADHTLSGKPCVQWDLLQDEKPWMMFPLSWRTRTHNKCRNSMRVGENGYIAPDGAFCFVEMPWEGYPWEPYITESCTQIPGILFAHILIIKLD